MNRESYKEYVENAIAYNRKMNEERKMRIPYIDGQVRCFNGRTSNYIPFTKQYYPCFLQTGVAQRHYNNVRNKRERMPPKSTAPAGQILSYPQREWKKKRYQYLRFFLQPKVYIWEYWDLGGGGSKLESILIATPVEIGQCARYFRPFFSAWCFLSL